MLGHILAGACILSSTLGLLLAIFGKPRAAIWFLGVGLVTGVVLVCATIGQ